MRRLLLWAGVGAWRAEVADIDLRPDGVSASGTQVGVFPIPYRLDYTLEAADGFITRSLHVEVAGEGWSRQLSLTRNTEGRWHCEAAEEGSPPLTPPGGAVSFIDDALDCDLGLSPLTNLMPIRRHQLQRRPGSVDLVAAWVSVPDLGLHASRQRYEHVRLEGDRAIVRYTDLGTHDGLVADLVVDRDGLVVDYPDLARRVT